MTSFHWKGNENGDDNESGSDKVAPPEATNVPRKNLVPVCLRNVAPLDGSYSRVPLSACLIRMFSPT